MSDDGKRDLSTILPLRTGKVLVYHHLRIAWQHAPGRWTTLESIREDPERGYLELLQYAIAMGYTAPHWWQFWRWGEPRYEDLK